MSLRISVSAVMEFFEWWFKISQILAQLNYYNHYEIIFRKILMILVIENWIEINSVSLFNFQKHIVSWSELLDIFYDFYRNY